MLEELNCHNNVLNQLNCDIVKEVNIQDEIEQMKSIKLNQLKALTHKSFELYSPRLHNISKDAYDQGELEFKKSNDKFIDQISKLNPISTSLSVTSDKSIHYIFRFKNNISAFFETYLDSDLGNYTFIEVFEEKDLLFSQENGMNAGVEFLKDQLSEIKSIYQCTHTILKD